MGTRKLASHSAQAEVWLFFPLPSFPSRFDTFIKAQQQITQKAE